MVEVRKRSQVKRDLCDSFDISVQGLLFKGRQNGIRCQRTDREEIIQWWSQALPTRLHRGTGWLTNLHSEGRQEASCTAAGLWLSEYLVEFAEAGANTELAWHKCC
jgi:hypothetical protein